MPMSFEDILNETVESVEWPKPMPVGTYQWVVSGLPRQDKSSQKQTDFFEFVVVCQRPMEDVDADALEEFGGVNAVVGKQQRLTFYITEDARSRLDHFLFNILGIETGIKRKEAVAQAPGRSFLAPIRHEPAKDGQRIFARLNDNSLSQL